MPVLSRPIIVCLEDDTPGPRDTGCPNALHDHPLPSGYGDAARVADQRLYRRWSNTKCPACGLYGWTPPAFGEGGEGNR